MSDVVKFIIFADARTGGTHVMSKLNSHPDVHAVSEPFPHHNLKTHEEQLAWMEEYFANKKKRKFKALGFRTKIEHQADNEQFVKYINDNKIICFSLQRRNLVKKAISRITAVKLYNETKDYNRKDKEFNKSKMSIKPNKLVKEIEICEEQKAITIDFLKELYNVSIIYYEQILIDEDVFFNKMIDRISMERTELVTSIYKNISDDLRESLENYNEIHKRLMDTKYVYDLEEVLIPAI